MFSIFRRKPRFQDAAFEDLARMPWQDVETPTYKRERLDASALDFSMDSLAAIEGYLDAIRQDEFEAPDLLRIVLRCGAYVGEVVRRHSATELHRADYDEAARESELVRNAGRDVGTMAVSRAGPDRMCFPLGRPRAAETAMLQLDHEERSAFTHKSDRRIAAAASRRTTVARRY